jgi:proteasome lid subunit RPN8/RPN11
VTTKEGAVEERFILAGPGSQKYIAKAEFKASQYTPLTPQEAAPLWEAENQARPKTYTEIVPMISGLTLPIWDRLPEYARVGRAQADDGQRVLGRIISKGDVPDVLRRLGLTSSVAKLPAESVFRMVKDEGQVGELVNAWTIKRSRVANEWRVELSPRNRYISPAMQAELNRYGLFIERIAYEERAFIPSPNALAKLLEVRPLADIKDSKSAGQAAEPGATYTVGEPAGAPNAQQKDLFGFDLAPQQGGRGLPTQRGGRVPGGERGPAAGVAPQAGVTNLGSAAPVPVHSNAPGKFLTHTTLIEASHRDLGASQVTTPEHLAQAMAYMARGADERLEGVVTDKAGKPIALVGSFKGAVAKAGFEPSTIIREAFMIDGAAHIWFVHNHPSGRPELSDADIKVNRTFTHLFKGSGIKPRGFMAIGAPVSGPSLWSWMSETGAEKKSGAVQVSGPPVMRIASVDRSLVQSGNHGISVDSVDKAKALIDAHGQKQTGVLFLDAGNYAVGFMPLNYKEVAKLRTGGRMDAIYRALAMSNASAAIISTGKLHETEVRNLAGLLNTADMKVLDAIEPHGASWVRDGKGRFLASNVFFSRQPVQRGISLDDLRAEFFREVEVCERLTFQLLTKRPENVARMEKELADSNKRRARRVA